MGRQVAKWIADDGTEFNDKKSMLLYEMAQVDEKEIDVFLKENFPDNSRRSVEYRKLLIKWQEYMRTNNIQMPVLVEQNLQDIESAIEGSSAPEWTPPGGFKLSEVQNISFDIDDDEAAIEKSFKRATKI